MIRTLALVAIAALAVPATTLAKGPTRASVDGPGLGDAITITGDGEAAGTPLGDLTQQAGFPPAVFGHRDPDPMLRDRPAGDLGPRYRITYTLFGPGNVQLRQDVYPYARPFPVTYTAPGQGFFGMRTHGGWFRADRQLKRTLVSLGLPPAPPARSSGDGSVAPPFLIALATALLGAGAGAIVLRRRIRQARAV